MSLLIYGANGYTGRLIVPLAVSRGLRPILSGRNAEEVRALANQYALEARPVALDDPRALDAALDGVRVVLHCAGPFSRTAKPMIDACLRMKAHYLDITGEWEVFELCAARDAEAKAHGIMLLPGTGFDVVPSDCLAAHLARRLPDATSLSLGFRGIGGVSRGTALTMAEGMGKAGVIRKEGKIIPVPPAFHTRRIDFGDGERLATTIPWGDVSTAYHSTGIPNVRVYMAVNDGQLKSLRMAKWFGWLLQTPFMQQRLASQIRASKSGAKAGPSEQSRARGASLLWGEATNATGAQVVSRIRAPEGYSLTADTAVRCSLRALDGEATIGFQTPSKAYGADYILEFDGVSRTDD